MSDYKSVFRNVRTPRRAHGYYPERSQKIEPMWMSFLGGAVMGIVLATMVWWAL